MSSAISKISSHSGILTLTPTSGTAVFCYTEVGPNAVTLSENIIKSLLIVLWVLVVLGGTLIISIVVYKSLDITSLIVSMTFGIIYKLLDITSMIIGIIQQVLDIISMIIGGLVQLRR